MQSANKHWQRTVVTLLQLEVHQRTEHCSHLEGKAHAANHVPVPALRRTGILHAAVAFRSRVGWGYQF